MKIEHVEGEKKAKIMLYTLSTCVWCNKTKKLLSELGVEYYFANIDQLPVAERDEAEKEMMKWNPSCSFPTMVIEEKTCIIGYKPDEIKEKLK